MIKLNKKFSLGILILFFLTTILDLLLGNNSKGLTFGAVSYLLFIFNTAKITKYDYLFAGSMVAGVVIEFVTIFYKNIALTNWFSVYITALALVSYLDKMNSQAKQG